MRRLVVECVGTFFFLLTIALTANPLAIASMLMAWVYIGYHISGGHYNPAVTLAVGLHGKWQWASILRYWAAQVVGGFLAFATAFYLSGHITMPQPSAPFGKAFLVEILLAFVFAFVVLVVGVSDRFKNSTIYGFAIGFTIPALATLGSPISGGLFNPAIPLGAHIFGLTKKMPLDGTNLFLYVAGALLGAALAVHAYNYFRFDEKR
jgi:aquaporin Z